MRILTATDPARPDVINEDFVAASHNAVVLLDGAGNPPGADQGCRHGVSWFARNLGTTLLNLVTDEPDVPLSKALGAAIDRVADLHRTTCDLQHPGSPSATVVVLRLHGSALDYLVLADSTLALRDDRDVRVICDDREATIGAQYREAMDALPSGTPEHARELRRYVEAMRTHRNRPGGFWVASSTPDAADEALTGSADALGTTAAVLLSDGASRLVDRFDLATWPQLVDLVAADGPNALIEQVRAAEHTDPDGRRWPRGKSSDDATVAYASVLPSLAL